MRSALRLLWLVAATGCYGGQTGEITMLGACHEDVGPGELGEVSAALDAMGREHAASITWLEPSVGTGDAELAIDVAERGPARLVGGEGCEHPFSSAPATVRVTSSDAAVDAALEGAVAPTVTEGFVVQARAPYEGPLGTGELRLDLSADPEIVTGMLTFEPAAENADTIVLARF